jgi:small-conductance mechanosensitive channel
MTWQERLFDAQEWKALTLSFLLVLAAAAVGWLLVRVAIRLSKHLVGEDNANNLQELLALCRRPALLLVPLLALLPISPLLNFPSPLSQFGGHLYLLLLITAISWLLINAIRALRNIILKHYDISDSDNLKARGIHTQIKLLTKIVIVVIGIVALACLLMTFDEVRQIGVSLLASAGVVGIIAGFAAQRSLATLFAGIQLAFTQPIRVDDVVIIEGEWGRIEEITLTYVVVRIWDERRLIVPIGQFLEKPFQNWTRVSAELLGTVFLYTDYRVNVEEVRRQLLSILQQSELWDGRVAGLQVTDSTEKTMVLRALMSAADSSKAWDLRCQIREQLIGFLQENYPESLPRLRAELELTGSLPVQSEFEPRN